MRLVDYLSSLIIHQILSRARDWFKHITWSNISQLFKTAHIAKNIWRIINTIACIWRKNLLGYLSLDIICSSKLTVFLELCSRKTVRFSKQIMSADKYPSIFPRQIEAIVYISNARSWNNRLIKQQDGNVRWRLLGARNNLDLVLIWPYLGICTARAVVKWRFRSLAKSAYC